MNTQSNFTGVFTLQTQEEVRALANAVQNLVEKSVDVFAMMSSGRAQDLLGYMQTINQVAPSFLALTIDENEKARAKAVLDSLALSQSALNTYLIGTSRPDTETRKLISRHMGQFLEKVADLCDMMEENQLNRGVQTVEQGVKYMNMLAAERPASQVFLPKLENAKSSLTYVDKLLENRISVADEGEVKVKMQQVREELRVGTIALNSSARALHPQPTNETHSAKYKEDLMRVLEALKVIMALVQGKEVRIKTSSNFSHETINAALAGLEDAVKTHDRNLATENAKTIVQEVQNAGSEELKAKTKEVVQATINALGGGYEDELSKALAELKDLAGSVHAENLGGVPEGSTIGRNNLLRQRLTEAAKDISHNVEDMFSPRSERFKHL